MPKKILLADDSVTIQKVVELTFSEGDYQVSCVSNGKQAIEHLDKDRPDILLCDIIMPEMSGYDVAEYIKKNPKYSAIPVILLTGTFEPFDEERAMKTGAETYVTKPFDSKMLIDKVESLLAKKVKVENVEQVAPATVFQAREEYEIKGAISDEAVEKLKEADNVPAVEESFPEIQEIPKDVPYETSGIEADFIPSSDEILETELPSSEAEQTVISSEVLPSFESLESVVEPPMGEVSQGDFPPPVSEEMPLEENLQPEESVEHPEVEGPAENEPLQQEVEEELKVESKEELFEAPAQFEKVEPPSFEEGTVEIPEELGEEISEETEKPSEVEDFNFKEVIKESISENLIDLGEEKEEAIPEFGVPSFAEEESKEPEIVSDLNEQVMMIKEEQEKLKEEKESEIPQEEPPSLEKIEEEESKLEGFEETPIQEEQISEEVPSQQEAFENEPQLSKEEHFVEEEVKEEVSPVVTPQPQVEISEEMIEEIVRKVISEMAPSIIKDIAWEVIPELANTIIKKRIEELEKEAEE